MRDTQEGSLSEQREQEESEEPQARDSLVSASSCNVGVSPPDAPARKTCLQFLKSELRPDKRLISLKIFAFFFYGGMYSVLPHCAGMYSVLPYFTMHMRQVGLTIKEMAIIYSVLPVPAILGPIVSGIIADRTAKFKVVLMVNILLSLIPTLCISFISPMEGAGSTSLTFNTTGLALTHTDCRPAHATDKHLTCSSLCLSEATHVMPYESYAVVCRATDLTQQIPLVNCYLPTGEDPECGRGIVFSPPAAQVLPYKVHRDSHIFIETNCTVYCMKVDNDDPFADHEMSNSKTFWLYLVLRVTCMLFTKSSFSMMDASIMAVMMRTGGDYGKQRLVAVISLGTFPLIASCIVNYLSAGSGTLEEDLTLQS
ncbi:Major facilitator superfamily associated domain [Trinorchestia longiramus]|nr:Major facilitator superfamily associated domain [Trinorchestia longiramus]